MDRDVSPVVIDVRAETSPSASDDSDARYGLDAGTDLGPSSNPSESDGAKLAHPLMTLRVEESRLFLDSSTGSSEDNAQSQDDMREGSISS